MQVHCVCEDTRKFTCFAIKTTVCTGLEVETETVPHRESSGVVECTPYKGAGVSKHTELLGRCQQGQRSLASM